MIERNLSLAFNMKIILVFFTTPISSSKIDVNLHSNLNLEMKYWSEDKIFL